MLSDKQSVRDLIYLLHHHGVRHVVVSPGSRNAPLSISLHHHPDIQTHVVIDERSAGFVALGMAQQLDEPVALCCTSGSAAYNYAPAIAEAHFQRIPLVVLSADRPEEWIGQGDGQTIYQSGMYGKHVKASVDVSEAIAQPDQRKFQWRAVHEALQAMRSGADGPVHFNVFLREPLYRMSDQPDRWLRTPDQDQRASGLSASSTLELPNILSNAGKVIILVGMEKPNRLLEQQLRDIANKPNTLVLTEHTSNLTGELFCGTVDRLLMTMSREDIVAFAPDVLITFGTNLISKKIKALFRENKPAEHWHIDPLTPQMDTYASLTRSFTMKPEEFFDGLEWSGSGDYAKTWQERNRANATHHVEYAEQVAFSDFSVVDAVHRQVPEGAILQMGNSTIVRYFLLGDPRSDIVYHGNRGTSGIDGCTSTAVGAAMASGAETWLVSGDVAFFYDSNALWNDLDKKGLKMILVNNQGGGIFRIIDGPSSSGVMEQYFESHHQRTAASMAADGGLKYQDARDASDLQEGLDWLKEQEGPALLEVFTPRTDNASVLKSYFQTLKHKMRDDRTEVDTH